MQSRALHNKRAESWVRPAHLDSRRPRAHTWLRFQDLQGGRGAARIVMSEITRSDVIISGGGMVGMTLALALGRAGLDVAVLDRQMLDLTMDPAFDGRASAIAYAGVRL